MNLVQATFLCASLFDLDFTNKTLWALPPARQNTILFYHVKIFRAVQIKKFPNMYVLNFFVTHFLSPKHLFQSFILVIDAIYLFSCLRDYVSYL
jgi:hypothetical protein